MFVYQRCSSSSFKKVDVIFVYLFLDKPRQNITGTTRISDLITIYEENLNIS